MSEAIGWRLRPKSVIVVPRHVIGRGHIPPSEKLNVAGIGVANLLKRSCGSIVNCVVAKPFGSTQAKSLVVRIAFRGGRHDVYIIVIITHGHGNFAIQYNIARRGRSVWGTSPIPVCIMKLASATGRPRSEAHRRQNIGFAFWSAETGRPRSVTCGGCRRWMRTHNQRMR